MRRVFASALILGLGLGLAGCSEKSKEESSQTVQTPQGTTTTTETKEIKQSGDNPPAAGTAEPPAPTK